MNRGSKKKLDILAGQHAAGLKADMLLKHMGSMHDEREAQIVNDLISWFLSKEWDEKTAIRYIALLSENRSNRDELIRRAQKGAHAREALFGGAAQTTADE